MSEIFELTAFELADAYRGKKLSPIDVAEALIARIERFEPAINAFSHRDDASVLVSARDSATRWKAGAPLGPLDGVPVTIKDNLHVKGWPSRRGSAVASDMPAPEDAPATARLREAGAIILGKTTMPELGWKGTSDGPAHGITRNPWDISRTTGGSSAGAAACGALGIGRIHIGTDGLGSVRIPSAFTGLVGLKPSYGRVAAWPISVMGFLAHLGPLTQTVRECALAMNVITGFDRRDMTAVLAGGVFLQGLDGGVKGLRVAFSPKLGLDIEVDPDVAALAAKAARSFEALGAIVEEVDPGFADPIAALMMLWSAGATHALRGIPAADRVKMDPGLVELAEDGARVTSAEYVDVLLYQRNAFAERMAAFHERYDLLLSPTMPLPAFEAGRLTPAHGRYGDIWTNWSPFTYPFNLSQQPAITVPMGLTRENLPAGLQIVGAFGADSLVLRAAAAFEAANLFPRLSAPRGSA